ncbi:MAG: double-strand break repair helicase AddA [Paracoccaceae bacterium]
MDDASLAQIRASNPLESTWLSANAGSGKTKVLTDRVARLLLRGTSPQRILCLTYTKAAASEMQNRLFRSLGAWAMMPDDRLVAELSKLGEDTSQDPDLLRRARRLFARAIETPGGLKIQTIHAFCASLLRRFPLEAAIAPDFSEADDRSLSQLRDQVLEQIARSPDAEALQAVFDLVTEGNLKSILAEIGNFRDAFQQEAPDFHGLFGVERGLTRDQVAARILTGDEPDLFARLVPVLMQGTKQDVTLAGRLSRMPTPGADDIPALSGFLLTGSGAKTPYAAKGASLVTKDTAKRIDPADLQALSDLSERMQDNRDDFLALGAIESAKTLHRFGRIWIRRFDEAKAHHGWLEFDDLIRLARRLLGSSSVAQWVLFKLDGGIDHILIDEAQDTSPEQWRVVDLLTQEFTAGQGARDTTRTIFVVGDRKQSIYSFQGADLRGFEQTRDAFEQRLAATGQGLNKLELRHSFRSSPAILRFVDACFGDQDSAGGLGGPSTHLAFHPTMPGRVDLWPAVPKPEKAEAPDWFTPLDRRDESKEDAELARQIARWIRDLIDRGEQLPTPGGQRRIHEGDILILVQRRAGIFSEVIRACKSVGLAVAGADRMILADELPVQDLIALLRFLALPEDDLALAQVLRSPIFGWDEDRLFRLAQGRNGYLWQQLRGLPGPETEVLDDLRGQVDFLRPYEILERLLTRHDARRRFLARFGSEADDAIEAFVDLALDYEQEQVPSLDGFLGWLRASDAEVKRQAESAGRRIRVMTVHGAKGLEAPIVILPETQKRSQGKKKQIPDLAGLPYLRQSAEQCTRQQTDYDDTAKQDSDQERDRLLYVALTRAKQWLVIAGAGAVEEPSWYAAVERAYGALPSTALDAPTGPGRRFEHGSWPAPDATPERDTPMPMAPLVLPEVPPATAPDAVLSPSALGGAKALPGMGDDSETAMLRGTLTHRLLEELSRLPDSAREEAAAAILAGADISPEQADEIRAEVRRLLSDPGLQAIFSTDALIEVGVSGEWNGSPMWGIVDRLILAGDRVLAVDFKTNRVVPESEAAVPEGLLRQMGAYAHLLTRLYPERRVETALLWTATGQLMPLSPETVAAALGRAILDPDRAQP